MRFRVLNSNIFPITNNKHMLHLFTIGMGIREFIGMACIKGPKAGNVYIEEACLTNIDYSKDVYAHCKYISDDNLFEDLVAFATEKNLLNPVRTYEEQPLPL